MYLFSILILVIINLFHIFRRKNDPNNRFYIKYPTIYIYYQIYYQQSNRQVRKTSSPTSPITDENSANLAKHPMNNLP